MKNKKTIIFAIICIVLTLILCVNYKVYIIDNNFNFLFFAISIFLCIFPIVSTLEFNLSKKQNRIYNIISVFLSIIISYFIIELLNKNNIFNVNLKRMVLNFIIIIFVHLLIYTTTNKLNIALILSNCLLFILGIVNYTVICFRGTPLVPWDILAFKTAMYVAPTYTFVVSYFLIVATLLLFNIICIVIKTNYKFNIIPRIVVILILVSSVLYFYKTDAINVFELDTNLWSPPEEYSSNGFLASFVKQSKNLFNKKPDNYSIKTIEALIDDIEVSSKEPSTSYPNIIVIMNESFSDLAIHR